MGANDTLDWVRQGIEWLKTPLAEGKPLLCLCLGAQMLARAFGARVFGYDDKLARSVIIRSNPRPLAIGCARFRFHAMSINGILTDSICLKARNSSRLAGRIFLTKLTATAYMLSACSFIRKSPII
jgi:hypothetical protein